MKLHRQEAISMHLYIKDTIIAPQYAEISTGMSLSPATTLINNQVVALPNTWNLEYDDDVDYGKEPFRRLEKDIDGLGRGLLYFDYDSAGTTMVGVEQTNRLTVYSGSDIVPALSYQINYLNGQLISTLDMSNYTVDYEWHFISVVDAWPWDEVPKLPIVTIFRGDADSYGYQLGGGAIREGNWVVEIFATNRGERDDLLDVIYEKTYMRRCPLYTFNNGLPLGFDGLYNNNFTTDLVVNQTAMYFDDVRKKLTGLPSWGFYDHELINRYRAQVTFTTRNYSF